MEINMYFYIHLKFNFFHWLFIRHSSDELFQKLKIWENTYVGMVLLGNDPIVVNVENVLSECKEIMMFSEKQTIQK